LSNNTNKELKSTLSGAHKHTSLSAVDVKAEESQRERERTLALLFSIKNYL
jgi:hypothetical protein